MRAPDLVSILIVTHDHADEIDACLDAALAQAGEGLDVEVVVADSASRDTAFPLFLNDGDGGPPPLLTPVARRGVRR